MRLNKKSVEEADTIMFVVNGGIGRNISATAVVRAIKKAYPEKELHVIAGSPDIFLRNPNIKRVHRFGNAFCLYEDFFMDKKSICINVEPYQHFDYIYKKKHFVECWCDMIGIPTDGLYPEIFFNRAEREMAQDFINRFDDPMILIQYVGGKNPNMKDKKEQIIAKTGMYRRAIPQEVIQEVADYYMSKGYMIGSVQQENQNCLEGAEKICFPLRSIIALIPYVNGIIAIDSFLQHASACFQRKSLVVWGGTSPKVLGYECHDNMTQIKCKTPFCHRPNSYLFDFEPNGYMWDCPHDDICMNYKSKEIIERMNKILKEDKTNGRIRPNPSSDCRKSGRRPEPSDSSRKIHDSERNISGKENEFDTCNTATRSDTQSVKRSTCPNE